MNLMLDWQKNLSLDNTKEVDIIMICKEVMVADLS